MSAPQKKGQSKTKLPQIKMSSIQLRLNWDSTWMSLNTSSTIYSWRHHMYAMI